LLLSQNTSTSASGQGVRLYLSSSNSITRSALIESVAGSSNDHHLAFYTNGAFANPTERMRIGSNGNVGIGTDAPMVALNVHDSTNARIALTNSSTGQTFPDGFELLATGLDAYLQNRSNGNMIFTTNNVERMRIDSSGNVGIGTDNPATRLDIQGVGGATTSPTVTATTGTSYIGWKSVNTGGSFWTAIDNSTGSSFSTGNTAYARVLWSNGAYPMVFSTNSTERMRIDGSGNVTWWWVRVLPTIQRQALQCMVRLHLATYQWLGLMEMY
jgi:hypothetical protein